MTTDTGLRVFIIDDNEMTRTLLRMMIQGEDYKVVGYAGTALAAMRRIAALRPDIVCLDVMMPDMNGLELLDWIAAAQPECIVLMITALNDRATVESALARGAKGFIVKPFNPGTVLDTMRKAVGKLRAPGGGAAPSQGEVHPKPC
ncbi:response regulator [Janthinobacterium sp.]|uniref:response regulator n=1 Tax=Janthinobacterium sp. TaxID=1871054 RepID=UPI00293D272C|nr:response regulator [Janthinobacterium sp.]